MTIGCSPLVTFIVYLNSGSSLKIEWLANALFLRAPITISVGYRLIISVREAASHHLTSDSHPVMMRAFFVVGDEVREEDNYVV